MAIIPRIIPETLPKACLLLLLLCCLLPDSNASRDDSTDDDDNDMDDNNDLVDSDNPLGPLSPLYRYSSSADGTRDSSGGLTNQKRALSLLAQLKPYYYHGGRSGVKTRSDIVSAVTRGGANSRPLGQPLRWG